MDILCFSHLRWDFVFQRPNHLLSRAARRHRVFFVEEPLFGASQPSMEMLTRDGVAVVVPHLVDDREPGEQLQLLTAQLVAAQDLRAPVLWYYTPMAVPWSRPLFPSAKAIVYDCMDHLAGFRGAPAGIETLELDLTQAADLVFTGGPSLFEARRESHHSVHCFPSSVDRGHFEQARTIATDPSDQADIPRPRLGYFGVLDERIDWELIDALSRRRPDWHLVLVGPFAKVDPAALPQAPNIHYLGMKSYAELPAYLAGWDVAVLPFARNEATRFISPTKTPEYLAGGRPVASTPIHDVIELYGRGGLVHFGTTPLEFVSAVEAALRDDLDGLRRRADALLSGLSWDRTWSEMEALIARVTAANGGASGAAEAGGAALRTRAAAP